MILFRPRQCSSTWLGWAALWGLLGAGCLDALLEAPYILTPGLNAPRGMSPSPNGTMLVATGGGLVEVDGSGRVTLLEPTPAQAVTAHPDRVYVLTEEGRLRWTGWPIAADAGWEEQDLGGITDIQAWCDQELRLTSAAGLLQWSPGVAHPTPAPEAAGIPVPPLQRLTISTTGGCGGVLALSADALLWIAGGEIQVLAAGLHNPRAVAADPRGGVWVVAGEPPELWTTPPGGHLERRVRHLEAPQDIHFGPGALLDPHNVFLTVETGRLDYAQVLLEPLR